MLVPGSMTDDTSEFEVVSPMGMSSTPCGFCVNGEERSECLCSGFQAVSRVRACVRSRGLHGKAFRHAVDALGSDRIPFSAPLWRIVRLSIEPVDRIFAIAQRSHGESPRAQSTNAARNRTIPAARRPAPRVAANGRGRASCGTRRQASSPKARARAGVESTDRPHPRVFWWCI